MFSRLIGLCGMAGCLAIVFYFESHSSATGIMRIFHWPALVLTGIGPIFVVMLCYGFKSLFKTMMMGSFHSTNKLSKRNKKEALYLHQLGNGYYEEGPSVFESAKTKGLTPFIKNMIERLALRMPTADVKELALIEKDRKEFELSHHLHVIGAAVKLSPSIGMLGTIMGMVNLLATLQDPSLIGKNMSLALLTTFFGLFFSIAVWTPIQQKLTDLISLEMESIELALHWIELLEKKKPAQYFEEISDLGKAKGKKS